MWKAYSFLIGLLFFSQSVYSQHSNAHAYPHLSALKDLLGTKNIKVYDSNIKGTPFLQPQWMEGEILTFDGHRFENLKLKYNLHEEALLYRVGNDSMTLVLEHIREFRFPEDYPYDFMRVHSYQKRLGRFKKGFYQVVYDGKTKLLMTVKKRLVKPAGTKTTQFDCKQKYFVILGGGRLKPLKPKKNRILRLLKHRKYEMERYMKMHALSPDNQKDLNLIITYYDTLI